MSRTRRCCMSLFSWCTFGAEEAQAAQRLLSLASRVAPCLGAEVRAAIVELVKVVAHKRHVAFVRTKLLILNHSRSYLSMLLLLLNIFPLCVVLCYSGCIIGVRSCIWLLNLRQVKLNLRVVQNLLLSLGGTAYLVSSTHSEWPTDFCDA